MSGPAYAKKSEKLTEPDVYATPDEEPEYYRELGDEVDDNDTQLEDGDTIIDPVDSETVFPELEHLQKLSEDQTATFELTPQEQEIYDRSSKLYSKGIDEANKLRAELGKKEFAQAMADNLVVFEDSELNGEIELSLLDGNIFARVKLNEYPKLSISYIDQKHDINSNHGQKFVARQHVKGSDVLIFATYKDKIENIKLDKRAPFFSWKRLGDFYKSWKAKPTAGDIIYMGILNGLAQGAMVASITMWKHGMPFLEALQTPGPIFTAFFGLAIGCGIKAYRNFTYAGGKLRRVMTSLSVSAAFAYIYAGLVNGPDYLFPGLNGSAEAWTAAAAVHGFLILNQFVNQVGKDDYFEIVRAAEKMRELRGDINVPGMPALSILNALHQGIYSLISFPLKMADQEGLKREAFIGSVIAFRAMNALYFQFRYLNAKRNYEKDPSRLNENRLKKITGFRDNVMKKVNLKEILLTPYKWAKEQINERRRRAHAVVKDCSGAFSRFQLSDIAQPR